VPTHTITGERLDLVLLTADVLEPLFAGRRAEAQAAGGFLLPGGWPDDHDGRWLRRRLKQMQEDPAVTVWLARAMVLRSDPHRAMVGHIGFHGAAQDGAAEMGYTVMPSYRRRGYAHEAVLAMMRWAREERGVQRFILSISPENAPSLALAAKLGFVQTGEQMDEEDGLEYVFELPAPA